MSLFSTRVTQCHACGHRINTAMVFSGARAPREGDITMCAYCLAVATFITDDGETRVLSDDEIGHLPDWVREQIGIAKVRLAQMRGWQN